MPLIKNNLCTKETETENANKSESPQVDQEVMPSQNDLEILSPQANQDLESNQEQGQEVLALEENNQVVQGNLFKGYFQLFRCGLICCLSLLDRQEQQFQQQIFFIST